MNPKRISTIFSGSDIVLSATKHCKFLRDLVISLFTYLRIYCCLKSRTLFEVLSYVQVLKNTKHVPITLNLS